MQLLLYSHFYKQRFFAFVVLCLLMLGGCAQMRSHNDLMSPVITTRNARGAAPAMQHLRNTASKSQQDTLLYTLELGELLRENKDYEASTRLWLQANAQVNEWERAALLNPRKLLTYAVTSTISERLKPYEAQDYEKTWLTTRIALNHIALNDWESARVDIKRTHEREAIIAEFRAKEIAAVRDQARGEGVDITARELGGYPVDYLDAPEVLALENSYQNAFSHYLAGFLYEVLNEPSLAAPGYRRAIELKPDTGILEDGLQNLEYRLSNTYNQRINETDVLFIIELGDAPARIPFETDIAIPIRVDDRHRMALISIAFPLIKPVDKPRSRAVDVGPYALISNPVVDLNAMARRALRDEMPGLILRGFTRAASKGALQYYANKEGDELIGILASILTSSTELADDRIWRTLPGAVLLARAYIEPGEYPLTISGKRAAGTISIHGQYAVVPVRIAGNAIRVGHVASYGLLPQEREAVLQERATRTPNSPEEAEIFDEPGDLQERPEDLQNVEEPDLPEPDQQSHQRSPRESRRE